MPPLNLDLLDPTHDGSLERYAAQIQELVLWIRDEGHILSPIDQHFVEQWWEAGYPLDSILEAVRESGLRLKGRKNPPRGLPLRSMKRWVVKAGERARTSSVGAHERGSAPEPSTGTSVPAAASTDRAAEVLAALAAEIDVAEQRGESEAKEALRDARTELESMAKEGLGESEVFAALLATGRRYYDACWDVLPVLKRSERREQISASLGDAAGSMDPEALEATVDELCRRTLRAEDPLFDPQRYWSLS